MKNKTLLLMVLFLFSLTGLQSQEAVLTAGGNASGNGGSASYSIGQVSYTTIVGTTGSAVQGIQHPNVTFIVGIDSHKDIILSMVVYPNPANEFVKLKIETENYEILNYQLRDLDGRLIINKQINSKVTTIPMANLNPAIYFLKISDDKTVIKIFKIIKN